MNEKIYVCTGYGKKSIIELLCELSDTSSIGWRSCEHSIGCLVDGIDTLIVNGCYLFISFDDYYEKYVLTYDYIKYNARLVTPNEFKRIAAELCPPVTK